MKSLAQIQAELAVLALKQRVLGWKLEQLSRELRDARGRMQLPAPYQRVPEFASKWLASGTKPRSE